MVEKERSSLVLTLHHLDNSIHSSPLHKRRADSEKMWRIEWTEMFLSPFGSIVVSLTLVSVTEADKGCVSGCASVYLEVENEGAEMGRRRAGERGNVGGNVELDGGMLESCREMPLLP